MRLKLPPKVEYIIDVLERHGWEAYAVGGCVRDSVLALEPKDWDITTSAKPEEVRRCFRRIIDTGIQHGTVTVMLENEGFEVTTYRIDGEYSDGRHPDQVIFTPNLRDDLMRRDFTINAMAYNPRVGLVDLYGGMQDLGRRVIRCVGDPDARFTEDALRIMRAVRFAARFGFRIESATYQAIARHADNLRHVSAERIREELVKTINSPHPEFFEELWRLGITEIMLPEFDETMKRQKEPLSEHMTVGAHSIRSMCEVPADTVLRMTMLLHEIKGADPETSLQENAAAGRKTPSPEESAEAADAVLRRLRFDNDTRLRVVNLIRCRDLYLVPDEVVVRRALVKAGPDRFDDLLAMQWADFMAGGRELISQKQQRLKDVYEVGRRILERGDCLSVKQLAINGTDLRKMGCEGKEIGRILKRALLAVLENPSRNTREELLQYAERLRRAGIS
ncbi:MAG: CCA tRNA nucleotidyltransferase [Lachnospiraceae bacterium]|nr:CCA tRNA nucleotidyltransferase [Lachnospiraceae bacterium]